MPEAENIKDENLPDGKDSLLKIQPEIVKEYASPACSYPELSDDFDE